jgi:hypothetical protein
MLTMLAFPLTVYADTNGSEIKLTDQPDQLILQLGPEWAGVEFELKTDAGIFPAPVIVDYTGILKMDLGGSSTYTLTCLTSPVSIPVPEPSAPTPSPQPSVETPASDSEPDADEPTESEGGVPTGILVFFILGLVAAVGGLLAMRYFKNRRSPRYYDDEEDDYE